MTDTLFFAFYGSLRRGMANHRLYEPYLEYIGTLRLPGYKLFALSDYPYAVRASASDFIVAELFQISDENVRLEIEKMELDAGYIFDGIEIGGKKVGIYLFPNAGDDFWIESGDWTAFLKERTK